MELEKATIGRVVTFRRRNGLIDEGRICGAPVEKPNGFWVQVAVGSPVAPVVNWRRVLNLRELPKK